MATQISNFAANTDAMALPSFFVIEQKGFGSKSTAYAVTLSGWCLPVGGLTNESEQRMHTTWYPGATQATAQVFGPKYNPTVINGQLRLRYMDGNAFRVENYGGQTFDTHTPEDAKAILEDMLRVGRQVSVRWSDTSSGTDQAARWGLVRRFRSTILRPQFIEWECEFEWLGSDAEKPTLQTANPPPDGKDLLRVLTTVLETIEDCQRIYRQAVNTVNTAVLTASDAVDSAIALTAVPAQHAQAMAVVAGNVRQAISDAAVEGVAVLSAYSRAQAMFEDQARNTSPLASLSNVDPTTGGMSPPPDDAASQVEAALRAYEVQSQLMAVKAENEALWALAIAQSQPTLLDTYTVKDGDTLRRLSTRYYGTPNSWETIADFNGLKGDDLTTGTVLRIPRKAA